MNDTPEIIAEKERLRSLTDEQLMAEIKQSYQVGACLIGVHIEARMRLHECQFHGRDNEEGCKKLLADSGDNLIKFFEFLIR